MQHQPNTRTVQPSTAPPEYQLYVAAITEARAQDSERRRGHEAND